MSPGVFRPSHSFGSVLEMRNQKTGDMRHQTSGGASLLFALRLTGTSADPISDAVELADRLLNELQRNE